MVSSFLGLIVQVAGPHTVSDPAFRWSGALEEIHADLEQAIEGAP
jgi:hypothetical protein